MGKNPITTEIKIPTYATLFRESDKGCLLLAVGIFDKILKDIVTLTILCNLKGKPPKDFLSDKLFGSNGPLHSFSSKIKIAYGFLLISDQEYDALHILRELRNEAAHCYFDFKFSDTGVAKHLKRLSQYDAEVYRPRFLREAGVEASESDTHKFEFVLNTYALLHDLNNVKVQQIHRYAKEVRGMSIAPIRQILI